jgi:AcrR family transcriptional regulator
MPYDLFMSKITMSTAQSSGLVERNVREQIVEAAQHHFSHYGYEKTAVTDLAKAIGFSKAYIYKFFDSKQAIGEVICASTLSAIIAAGEKAITGVTTSSEKFRLLFNSLVKTSTSLFFQDRKLYDIAATACGDGWPPARAYETRIQQMLKDVIIEGRQAGEFEGKTPLDETVQAIYLVMLPFLSPLLLQYNLDRVEDAPLQLANLVLRSLAP